MSQDLPQLHMACAAWKAGIELLFSTPPQSLLEPLYQHSTSLCYSTFSYNFQAGRQKVS